MDWAQSLWLTACFLHITHLRTPSAFELDVFAAASEEPAALLLRVEIGPEPSLPYRASEALGQASEPSIHPHTPQAPTSRLDECIPQDVLKITPHMCFFDAQKRHREAPHQQKMHSCLLAPLVLLPEEAAIGSNASTHPPTHA